MQIPELDPESICLISKNTIRVPGTSPEREILVAAGLGEKVFIPDISCSWNEFKGALVSAFPKLESSGGFTN